MNMFLKAIRLLEIILGTFFLLSAIGKMADAAYFGELISSYGFDWFSILAPIIILVEFFTGACLILQVYVRAGTLISIIMLVAFTAAFSYAHFVNGIEDCGCFGHLGTKTPVWITYLRNGILLLFALTIWIRDNKQYERAHRHKFALCFLLPIMTVAVFWTGHTWQLSSFYVNRFARPHRLIGLDINKTLLNQYISLSKDSTYIVWVFSYTCSSCINSIENIKQYQDGVADKFIALSVTDDEDGRKRELLDITFDPIEVGDGLVGFIEVVPTLLYIEEGKIKYVIEHSVPSIYNFKSIYLEMTNHEILQQKKTGL